MEKNTRIKVKNFTKKSRNAAKNAYELTDGEYDQVNAFIRENSLSPDAAILVEGMPDGIKISICDADDIGVQDSGKQTCCHTGNYVKATLEPGKAPLIQGSTTDPFMSKGFAIISLAASLITVIWYASRFYFDVKDQIAARANDRNATNDNNLSN